jgi:hypothetical protein
MVSKIARLNGNVLFIFSEIFCADKYLARYAQKRMFGVTPLLVSDFNQIWNGRQIIKFPDTKS